MNCYRRSISNDDDNDNTSDNDYTSNNDDFPASGIIAKRSTSLSMVALKRRPKTTLKPVHFITEFSEFTVNVHILTVIDHSQVSFRLFISIVQ